MAGQKKVHAPSQKELEDEIKKEFSKYDEDDADEGLQEKYCCTCERVIRKLVTKEDPIYLHKTLGFLALCSFIYRYFYLYPT